MEAEPVRREVDEEEEGGGGQDRGREERRVEGEAPSGDLIVDDPDSRGGQGEEEEGEEGEAPQGADQAIGSSAVAASRTPPLPGSGVAGRYPGRRTSRTGCSPRQRPLHSTTAPSASPRTRTVTGPQGVGAGPNSEVFPFRVQSRGMPEARISRSSSSRTNQLRIMRTQSEAAQMCCPSPMQPPPVRGWTASGHCPVLEASPATVRTSLS